MSISDRQNSPLSAAAAPIPLVDLKAQYRALRPAIDAAIANVIQNASFIMGPEVGAFEAAFADFCGAPHAIGISSGTAALELTLRALDVGAGDEVITTAHTFIATAEAISAVGATPVFVDIDPHTYTLDPAAVAAAIGKRTRALMPVHLYGQPANLDALGALAREHGLALIEDAAQAHGATWRGSTIGGWRMDGVQSAACFSFYPGKNLGAYGDAGAVVTHDDAIAERVRLLRNHGRRGKYLHEIKGFGERMDTLQAAILLAKLPHLWAWTESRRALAARYSERLAGLPLALPQIAPEAESAWHLYVVLVEPLSSREGAIGGTTEDSSSAIPPTVPPPKSRRVGGGSSPTPRDQLLAHLKAAGIGAGVHYPIPLHLQPAYADAGYGTGDLPITESAAARCLSLPLFPEMTRAQQDRVIEVLREFFEEQRKVVEPERVAA